MINCLGFLYIMEYGETKRDCIGQSLFVCAGNQSPWGKPPEFARADSLLFTGGFLTKKKV
jgi:hypothetical protein